MEGHWYFVNKCNIWLNLVDIISFDPDVIKSIRPFFWTSFHVIHAYLMSKLNYHSSFRRYKVIEYKPSYLVDIISFDPDVIKSIRPFFWTSFLVIHAYSLSKLIYHSSFRRYKVIEYEPSILIHPISSDRDVIIERYLTQNIVIYIPIITIQ